jgi:hypothetical protein
VLVVISWRSLRNPPSHGFPRFFAWEAICAMAALDLDRWFDDPFARRMFEVSDPRLG